LPTLPECLYFSPQVDKSRKPRMFRRCVTLTTTTSFFASHMPGSHAGVPLSKPPPCSHTITGFGSAGLRFKPGRGVGGKLLLHTFSTQHCSDISSSDIGRFVCCIA